METTPTGPWRRIRATDSGARDRVQNPSNVRAEGEVDLLKHTARLKGHPEDFGMTLVRVVRISDALFSQVLTGDVIRLVPRNIRYPRDRELEGGFCGS